jgi:hypothetical protein
MCGRQYRTFTHAVCVTKLLWARNRHEGHRHGLLIKIGCTPRGAARLGWPHATPTAFDVPPSGLSRPKFSCVLDWVIWRGVWKRVEGWVRWSNPMCATLRKPGTMSPSPISQTLANGLAADSLVCDVHANPHRHLKDEVDLERVVEIGDFGFSEFWGGCGFRWSYSWSLPWEDSL